MEFKNKVAIVTGGTRGIGKAICNYLLAKGCNVIATGTKQKKTRNKNLMYKKLNFLEKNDLNNFLQYTKSLKKIDILINNAGINFIEPIDAIKEKNWDEIIKVNLKGPMLLSKSISQIMKKNRRGKIVNISSIWGIISKEKRDAYSASKTGLIGLTRAMALDLAPYNILVNALCPGFTMTQLTESTLSKEEIKTLSQDIPLKRFASVDEIAKIVAFLCSDLNTYITGQSITIDGGFTIK